MIGTPDVVVGTPVIMVDTQGTTVTDTQKIGDIMYLTALYMRKGSDVQCNNVYSLYKVMYLFTYKHISSSIPVFYLCTIKEDEDGRGMELEHLLCQDKEPDQSTVLLHDTLA